MPRCPVGGASDAHVRALLGRLDGLPDACLVCYTGAMVGDPVKGEALVIQARVARVHPWLLLAIVAIILLLTAALLIASQSGLTHAMSSLLQRPAPLAGNCLGGTVICP
jgi:hypothetical protein